jgi:hypothetical protein
MPLVRAQDEVYGSFEGIHFLMHDPSARQNVACIVTREALADRGSTHNPPLDLMQVFESYRIEVERAAGDLWDRGEIGPRRIIRVTRTQFPPQPTSGP